MTLIINTITWVAWIVLIIILFLIPAGRFSQDLVNLSNGRSNNNSFTQEKINNYIDYLFLLRVPIISGIILFVFPIISQTFASQFLQNLFVMTSGQQLMMVMIFTPLTSITIISVVKTISVLKYPQLNTKPHFVISVALLTFILFTPTWLVLLTLNKKDSLQGLNIDVAIIISFFASFLMLLGFLVYDFRRYILSPKLGSITLVAFSTIVTLIPIWLIVFILNQQQTREIYGLNINSLVIMTFTIVLIIFRSFDWLFPKLSKFINILKIRPITLVSINHIITLVIIWLIFFSSNQVLNTEKFDFSLVNTSIFSIFFLKLYLERLVYAVKQYNLFKLFDNQSKEKYQQLKFRRILITRSIIFIGFIIYAIVICLNYPPVNGQSIISENYQAPTLLYALLIIWIMTFLLGGLTYYFELSFNQSQRAVNPKYGLILYFKKALSKLYQKSNYRWLYNLIKFLDFIQIKFTFRIPIFVCLILFSALGYWNFQVDHFFKLEQSSIQITDYQQDFKNAIGNRLCPEDFQNNKPCQQEQSLVIIAASGGGIQSSGWTAQVLAGLQQEIGNNFTKSIGLISAVSGGSVGTMFYLDKFKDGVLNQPERLLEDATEDWLASVGWGVAFPDLLNITGFPFILNLLDNNAKYLDRGYALEKDWQQHLNRENLTLDSWYEKIIEGEIPIPVFNATLVENGRRFLVSPLKFLKGDMIDYLNSTNGKNKKNGEIQKIKQAKALDLKTLFNCGTPNQPKQCNLMVTTAARLSASFPYVSPMPRNYIDSQGDKQKNEKDNKFQDSNNNLILQNYHIADGGYFDNGGTFTAIQWLNSMLESTVNENHNLFNIKKVILIDINAFPEDPLPFQENGDPGFLNVGLGAGKALNGVRDATQIARNLQAIDLLKNRWKSENITIANFVISFPLNNTAGKSYHQPLSWRLTKVQKDNLRQAWETDPTIIKTVQHIKDFWNQEMESLNKDVTCS